MTKEEEILRAAEEEFFMNGYDACSTAVIAKRADVTDAALVIFDTVCRDSMGMHARRLEQSIAEGAVSDCTMHDIYYLVLTLATAPFMTIPLLENVSGFTADMVDDYLRSRRVEMVRTIEARFSRPKIG